MEARHVSLVEGVHQEDVIQPMDGVEARSEASVVLPSTEPDIAPSKSEQPLSSSLTPLVDAIGRP